MAMSKQEEDPAGFLDLVGPDLSACVFRRIHHPADLARAATVSRPWRTFVEGNDFLKKACEREFPELAVLTGAVEVRRSASSPQEEPESSGGVEARAAQAEHRIYSHLYAAIVANAKPSVDCIMHCIGASSTDNFPEETIDNTLEPQDRISNRASYWSSAGQDLAEVPETLTYRLSSDICVVHEIRIQPFKAFFQIGDPIYSSKMVRFRMGHSKVPRRTEPFVTDDDANQARMHRYGYVYQYQTDTDTNQAIIADENYIWTYTSPEFPMLQENTLQSFKLPRPVLCIGGVVKIELLGRVQKQATDDRYYICVSHAQVVGRSLSPVFMADINDSAGYAILKYLPGAKHLTTGDVMQVSARDSQEWNDLLARCREMMQLLQEVQGDAHLLQELQGHAHLLRELRGAGVQAMEEDDVDGGGVSDNDPFA